jgi:hypothetical protein
MGKTFGRKLFLSKNDLFDSLVGRYTKHAYYKRQDPNYGKFTGDQISFIQAAARFTIKNTATNLSELTHDTVYRDTPRGEVIPLSAMSVIRVKVPRKLSETQKDKGCVGCRVSFRFHLWPKNRSGHLLRNILDLEIIFFVWKIKSELKKTSREFNKTDKKIGGDLESMITG